MVPIYISLKSSYSALLFVNIRSSRQIFITLIQWLWLYHGIMMCSQATMKTSSSKLVMGFCKTFLLLESSSAVGD